MEEVKQLVADIRKGNIKPVYFLMGDEPYYIDKIAAYIEHNILSEEEKGFNQMVLYGRDVSVEEVVSNAKRYPMMAERQVVILKEAQDLSRTIEKFENYVENPQPTTVLVICYKYKTIDKRKKLYKALKKCDALFESKKLYDNQVPDWIRRVLAGKKYSISVKASQMLVEFLGTDLGRINNELEKLQIILPEGTEITPEIIEENIGISKDYNNFELRKAIGNKDVVKATRIINYFAQNPKDNPLVVTVSLLHNFFTQLLQYHGLSDHSKKSVASTLKINPFFVGEYQVAAKNYPMKKVSSVISHLREVDVQGKGVGANLSQADLLKELLIKIMS
ncbi:DNA polymerase III, delta subunit [Zhouia amylolytica]|uniref:DNA polymerase III subunit delta n=2 Tax=Zhouia amylolytica TaxID=376730 RepID=W2UN35_9FLAO|nr:DNA polymerase III subunit delta [Zhouia amylolytica]ETN95585.1 DNA polymerase iii, delta subunit [Zhouia amylolytica AD3]MCQ0110778.1 DNA polymerase III subunit delta [Zhouia amylolytica]SFT04222.1 DNA polymerase III, delta subunit [Zhouia amylolytica]